VGAQLGQQPPQWQTRQRMQQLSWQRL
jgi:hypothetical protein